MIDFEAKLSEENVKSRRVAWRVVALLSVVVIFLTLSIILMTPLKQTDLKILVVDKNTGYPTELTSLAKFESNKPEAMTGKEALNKYFAQKYITWHDSYNFYNIRKDYEMLQLYSSKAVFNNYLQRFEPPIDIEKKLGQNKSIDINIISLVPQNVITPFKDTENGVTMTARVEKTLKDGAKVVNVRTGIVTLTFGYATDNVMDEKTRNLNPLGFTTTSYRWDSDQ